MSDSFLYGKTPPFLLSFSTNRRCSSDKPERDISIKYAVFLNQKEDFIASLPDVLAADSLSSLFSASELEERGVVSSRYAGMELNGIAESGEGKVRVLTITYTHPADGYTNTSRSDMSAADLRWWTSEPDGLVYHERKKIDLTDSQAYAIYALGEKHGLKPNGASLSPDIGDPTVLAEASWGPDEDEEEEEGGGDSSDNQGQPSPTGSLVSVISSEAVQLSHMDIAHACGLDDNIVSEHGTKDLDTLCAMLESGQIYRGKNFSNGQECYYYNSPDASAREVFDGQNLFNPVSASMEDVISYGKAVAANPVQIVPCTTISITYKQRLLSTEELAEAEYSPGSKMINGNTPLPITTGGVNIPPPQYSFPDPVYADIPTVTCWVYCGRSMDSVKIISNYKTGSKRLFKDVTFTATFKSMTFSTLKAQKEG